jgi:hypothetical protein
MHLLFWVILPMLNVLFLKTNKLFWQMNGILRHDPQGHKNLNLNSYQN